MVYFKTNWIKDSNQWVIRKVRPWWVIGLGGFMYFHFTLYEYLGRRVSFFNRYFDKRTEEEKINDAKKLKSDFGYTPRYEPTLQRSIKKRKYAAQSLKETLEDTPLIKTNNFPYYKKDYGVEEPEDFMIKFNTLLEKSRIPGQFDYTQAQTYHTLFPEIEQAHFVTIEGETHKNLSISDFAA